MTNDASFNRQIAGCKTRGSGNTADVIELRQLQDSDSDEYFKWINDKSLVIQNAPFRPISRAEHDKWFSTITKCDTIRIFSIVLRRDSRHPKLIGSCSLRNIDMNAHLAELQIRIGERCMQGKGYGTAAIQQLLQYGFETLALERINLDVFYTNKRAIKAYEKCGFYRESIKCKGAFIDDSYVDILTMSISKNRSSL